MRCRTALNLTSSSSYVINKKNRLSEKLAEDTTITSDTRNSVAKYTYF